MIYISGIQCLQIKTRVIRIYTAGFFSPITIGLIYKHEYLSSAQNRNHIYSFHLLHSLARGCCYWLYRATFTVFCVTVVRRTNTWSWLHLHAFHGTSTQTQGEHKTRTGYFTNALSHKWLDPAGWTPRLILRGKRELPRDRRTHQWKMSNNKQKQPIHFNGGLGRCILF